MLEWVQKTLSVPLDSEDQGAFLKSKLDGSVFWEGAGNKKFFIEAGIPFVASAKLATLAEKIFGKKSKCYRSTSCMSCIFDSS